jgi:protein-tyrosine phosphatase
VGFVDIHSHFLFSLDDGARTVEESLAMLQLAAEAGTTDIVGTPHANGRYRFSLEAIEARMSQLRGRTPVRLHRGCDFHLHVNNIEDALEHPQKYSINGGPYLLVELPDMAMFANTDAILQQLLDGGMVPIVTHPERNAPLRKRLDDLARWVGLGCYVQVTGGSCTGRFGRSAQACVEELMRRGLVHFVASDAHDTVHRPPDLREAYEALVDRWGDGLVRPLFVENPAATLTGAEIEHAMRPRAPARKWYQFWRA